MAYYLALDAGGTKTRCVLADETKVLASASCGSVKLMRVGEEEASERLRRLLGEVSSAAGVGLKEITRTCMGLSAVQIPAVREWGAKLLGEMVSGEVLLYGDEEIALDAAFQGGQGILVVAGTGAIVAGRCEDGTMYRAGGWGPALGDEGSGYWIGQEAVKAALWGLDRGVETKLLQAIEEAWEIGSVGEIVEVGNERPDFAALAPVVARCAAENDELAAAVLENAGQELAEQVALVRLKMTESGTERVIGVAYTGSVLEHIPAVKDSMVRALADVEVQVQENAVDSLEGALWRARQGD